VQNHVLVSSNSNKKNISFEQSIFLHQNCTHSVLCHNSNNNNNNNNNKLCKFRVGSPVLCNSSFDNNKYLNSKVIIILALYTKLFFVYVFGVDPTLPFKWCQWNAVLKVWKKTCIELIFREFTIFNSVNWQLLSFSHQIWNYIL
jgi:hypothetical protein